MATMPMREQNARRFLGIASTLGVMGVAFNLNSDDGTLPKLLAAAAVVALVWSIHRFGRLGPDEMILFEEPEVAPKKKKRKKKRADAAPTARAESSAASSDVASEPGSKDS